MSPRIQSAVKISLFIVPVAVSHFALGQTPRPETIHPNWGIVERQTSIVAIPVESFEDSYLRADALRKAGRNQEALAAIKEAVRFGMDCGKCFGMLSGIEGNLQKYTDGVGDGDIGVKRSKTPRHKAMSAYNKGFNLGGLNRNTEALDAYNLSVAFDPTYAIAYFGKGKALYFLRQWTQSKSALEEALKLNPQHAPSWAYLAEDQIYLGDPKSGLTSANRAVELAPSDARSFRSRTIARFWEHDYEGMLADATRTLELDSDRPHAHLLRGHAFKLLGRESESVSEYALEPDRRAVEAGMFSPKPLDTRIYNCGDYSTELQSPLNFNVDGFNDCTTRVIQALDNPIKELRKRPDRKPVVPGIPSRK